MKYTTSFRVFSDICEEFPLETGPVVETPAETFDTFQYRRFLSLASPGELEGNFCNPETYRKVASEFPREKPCELKGLKVRDDSYLSDEGELEYCFKYL